MDIHLYRKILDNMPNGYVYCRVIYENGRPVDLVHESVNPAYENITGLYHIKGKKITEVMPGIAESNPDFFGRLLKVAETGTPDHFESYHPEMNEWYSNSVFCPEKGSLVSIIELITEHKRSEDALKQSETRFKTLFHSRSAIQALIDPDTGKILDVNQTAVDWYGWSADEMKQMCAGDFNMLSPTAVKSSLSTVAAEQHNIFIGRHRRADGSVRDVEVFRNRINVDGKDIVHVITHDITERKATEHALQESEARFRNMFENHSAIMMVLDPYTGDIVDANNSAVDFYGWPKEELRRMNIRQITNLPFEVARSNMEKARSSLLNRFVFRHRRADNSSRDIEVFSSPIEIKGKELLYVIIHDITERIEAEENLKRSEERFRRLFQDHSAIMMVIDAENGSIVDANQSAANFYGWSKSELCQMAVHQINTLQHEQLKPMVDQYRKLGKTTFEFHHRRKDGSIRDVEVFSNNIEITNKTLNYLIINDITTRKHLEAQTTLRLRLLEKASLFSIDKLLQYTLDELEMATGSTIGFFHFVSHDQNALLLKAYSTNTLQHMCRAQGLGAHYPLDKAGVWADAVREKKPVIHNDYAALMHCKGMPEGHAEVKRELVVPILRDGLIAGILGIGNKPFSYNDEDARLVLAIADQVWDIIEKKQSEERYRQIEEQLHHSRKMESIGQLASGIAHEINNPLNFIQINFTTQKEYFTDFLSLLNDYRNAANNSDKALPLLASELQGLRQKDAELGIDSLVQDMNEMFDGSQKGIDRIKKIVEGMRSLSYRHAADKKVLSDINKGITDTLNLSGNEYRFCADVVTEPGQIPPVPCLPDQINQVLLNLIVNSAHAIQSQQRSSNGRISIKTWADGQNVYCSIADDGPGIPDAIRKEIFNPFFTTKEAGKGTGLGLSICYDIIVNKHKGTFSVDCPQEGGAVFTFSLPLSQPEQDHRQEVSTEN